MKKFSKHLLIGLMIAGLLVSSNSISANNDVIPVVASGKVTSIKLESAGMNYVQWTVDGYSAQGFKVVWSKNENPTYPTREGDKYNYYPDPNRAKDMLTPFSGDGTYFVRVCEYLGGKCGVYSNQITVTLPAEPIACTMEYAPVCGEVQVQCVTTPCNPIKETFSNKCMMNAKKAKYLYNGECNDKNINPEPVVIKPIEQIPDYANDAKLLAGDGMSQVLAELKQLRNLVKEQNTKIKYLEKLTSSFQKLSDKMESALNNFITYGVDNNTQKLGEGERAAVISSYKSAYEKLPETEADLADAIKIANGRWPSATSTTAEMRAKELFTKIYKRIPDMSNAKDNAAVTVMAYGLRQRAENRNMKSETTGIKTFKGIFGKNPSSTEDWNAMQAITYSGASREKDSDGDLLPDAREEAIGTDPSNKDSDGDGHIDGTEVVNGFDPLKK